MEVKKGMTGRRVCGTLEALFGGFLLLSSIVNAAYGAVSILGFLAAVFIIVTGSLGMASKNIGVVIGYMVTGIICALALGVFTIVGIVVVANYEDYDYYYFATLPCEDTSTILSTLIITLLFIAVTFVVSVLGVIFACVPLCARNHEQETFQRFNEPVGAVEPSLDYNYSNTGYVHTARTQQNNYDNRYASGSGAPNYNNSNTAPVDTKQGLV